MKHVIVTGAYGLIGSHICEALPKDWQITKVKFDAIPPLTEMADYIIHGAGYGQPQLFLKDELSTIDVNTRLTADLFKYYLKPGGSFLFLSTSEIYSGLGYPQFKEEQVGTTTPLHPRACYIESKRCGETICMAQRRLGVDAKVARIALVYGEGTKAHDTRVLNQFIEKALTQGTIELLDSGNSKRTYCYITDAVKMLLGILFQGKEPIYNVGGASTTTISNLAKLIAKLTYVPVTVPLNQRKSALEGAPKDVSMDIGKVLAELKMDIRDLVPLEVGLERVIKWQKENLYA